MIHLPPRSHKNSTTEIRLHIEGYGLCGRYLISPGVKGAYAVREPQMPKGVEHSGSNPGIASDTVVREPQMPKGVEHIFSAELWAAF